MNTIVEVQLVWKDTPKNFIEEPIHINDDGFELSICDGVALAKINPVFHGENPSGHGVANFVQKPPQRRPKGSGPKPPVSAFDENEGYDLTALGQQFVHYALTDLPLKIEFTTDQEKP